MGLQDILSLELLFHLNPISKTIALCTVLVLTYYFYVTKSKEYASLRAIPGPWIASITKLWIVNKQRLNHRQTVDIELHRKYGSVVRVGPREVMFSSPLAFRTIYGAGNGFAKSDWYSAMSDLGWRGPESERFSLLIETDMEKYRRQRRFIGPAYTAEHMRNIEVKLDEILIKDIAVMDERAGEDTDADLFFNRLASDCISIATFSVPHGLVQAGEDDGLIRYVHNIWNYVHLIGYFPLLHRFLVAVGHYSASVKGLKYFLPRYVRLRSATPTLAMSPFRFPMAQIAERIALNTKSPITSDDKPTDILGRLLQISNQKEGFSTNWVASMCFANFGAGVETTAVTVSSLVYQIVNHPGCQEKVHAEIEAAKRDGKLSHPPKLREMKDHLPYLSACLSESLRLHHVVGMALPRVVPEGGCILDGYEIPAGTMVGVNAWVLNRNIGLYGEDADEWRPERWLEYTPEYLKHLETYNFSFGAGARSCPGKHLAQAMYHKIIPSMFSEFEWEFAEPDAERILKTAFTVRYMNLMMRWKRRASVSN